MKVGSELKKKLAVLDFETDPFVYGCAPEPFAAGLYDGNDYVQFWGNNCVVRLIDHLRECEPMVIYAHNGGKFDFMFLIKHGIFEGNIKIINSRIVKAKMGDHEFRDSYAIIPIGLAAFEKTKIDYNKFTKNAREKNKTEILEYLESDCRNLYELVEKFIAEFGVNLTIGGTAIKIFEKMHPFEKGGTSHDQRMRPFYFGGRVQCFEQGILHGDFKVYDVNSMYPAVMKNYSHPVNLRYSTYYEPEIAANNEPECCNHASVYFAHISAINDGVLPCRAHDGSLTFSAQSGDFFACSHEIRAGIRSGKLSVLKYHEILIPDETSTFAEYVDFCMAKKLKAEADGDKAGRLFAKLLANSCYGKTGTNPENFRDYKIKHNDDITADFLQEWDMGMDYGEWGIWERPAKMQMYYDVAIAASITSAARAELFMALQNATRAVYCDTDSIICEALDGVEQHDTKIGAWKTEGGGNKIAIAGKKMYALFSDNKCEKMACKGVELKPGEIVAMCQGATINYKRDAPSLKLDGSIKFVERNVKMS